MEIGMEFGLLYEWGIPSGTSPADEAQFFTDVVDQVKLAESVGFKSVWSVEHHFLDGFSSASAPEVLLSFIAAATSTIRIGHGVRLLPYPYNHPVRAAEQAATLDLLSGGRLEFGSGRSATVTELGGFNIDPSQTRDMWEESLRLIVEAWTNPTIEHHGRFFDVPERAVIPKPLQGPHPPLWMSATSPDSHAVAGKNGLGLLSFTLALANEELKRRVDLYREDIKTATPIGRTVNDQVAVFTMAHCAPTDEEAKANAEDGVMNYQRDHVELLCQMLQDDAAPKQSYEYYERFLGVDYDKFTFDYLQERDMIMVGSPERCIQVAKQYENIGVDRLLCHLQFRGMSNDKIRESIRLFGEEVIPAFS
jgi:alkanesulfonate monooxygenase SsuD/methylene tetrahydromethanopterin reductase-like flavin-dependent oxidoreductase (luciferase family)